MAPSVTFRPAALAAAVPWWTTRRFVAFAALCSILPLLWPALPPLVDLPGHVGRYRILADATWIPDGGPLARHWATRWSLMGNLGVDLLVVALHPLLDVEPAARLVVTAIPLCTILALLWLAREAHGRLPAGAGLALPLAYAFPFQFGFVNFCLAQAMAFAGLALWLRLARTQTAVWRITLFGVIAPVTWLVHSFGWAMLGLFVFGAEWQSGRAAGRSWTTSAIRAAVFCLPMALPLALMIGGGAEQSQGDTGDWFHWIVKAQWLVSILRERWRPWDVAGVVMIACVLWTAVRSRQLAFVPVLGVPALLSLVAFIILPRLFQGGSYVDMRMLPAAAMLALLAIRVVPDAAAPATEQRLAWLASGFLLARTAVTTVAFALYANGQTEALAALPALPANSAVLVLVNEPPSSDWSQPRLTHIAGLAVARTHVYVNEQWALRGQQPIRPLHPHAAPLDRDPSQLVYPKGSEYRSTDFDTAIAHFDRCTFQAVWTIGFPAYRAHARDILPVWSDGRSTVYRVARSAQGACR